MSVPITSVDSEIDTGHSISAYTRHEPTQVNLQFSAIKIFIVLIFMLNQSMSPINQ